MEISIPEIIDETCGRAIPCDNIDKMEREIFRIGKYKTYFRKRVLTSDEI
jgi:hypothetical protein